VETSVDTSDERLATADHRSTPGRVHPLGGRWSRAHPDRKDQAGGCQGTRRLLQTGDEIDPKIGDRVFRTKSSEQLFGMNRIVEWAKGARLVRASKGLRGRN
jgi:hypothetical protein